jgi:NAD(P)-dependent dehydrogenase (short-subunit alcohol dehydrogenase family)
MPFSISGKATLITGGTAGIGLATAKHFAEQGAKVVISGRRENGEDIAGAIGCQFVQADMSHPDDIESLFSQAVDHLGKLDVVINNAGIGPETGEISDADMDAHDLTVTVNMRAAYHVLKLAPGHMNNGGSIINTASVSGMEGDVGLSSYCATKAALISLTKSSALELAARKIRVNAISPGPVKSEIWGGHDPIELCKTIIPLGRIGEAAEVATVFHFLASSAASYITGTNLPVDGGYMTGMPKQLGELIDASLNGKN